ncbi:MAG: hypothetical protein KGL39_47465 [Patescibacteria group bacterium]|nr:hypothetical protein [Patescibacteria group bacterium]
MTSASDLGTRAAANAHDLDPIRADQVVRRKSVLLPLAAMTAGDTQTVQAVMTVPAHVAGGIQVQTIKYVPSAIITSNSTNYKTLSFTKISATGSNDATGGHEVATMTTKTAGAGGIGTTVALGTYSATLNTAIGYRKLAVGEAVGLTVTGATMALPAALVEIVYDEL